MGNVPGLIVFDLDGTLIDSRRDLADAANALIGERGGTRLDVEAIGRMVGDGAAMLVRRALTAAGIPLDETSVPRFLELYDACLLRTTRPYPGMHDALQAIRNTGTLAVLTNKPLTPSRKLLAALDLATLFDAVIGGDGPFPRKPDPQGMQHLMRQYQASPRQTVLVGDSPIDAATARAAGVMFCRARYGFGALEDLGGADAQVDAPLDIPSAIASLLR